MSDIETQINGIGSRLNMTEKDVAAWSGVSGRNKEDIQTIFGKISAVQESVNSMPWKFMAMLAVPTVLILISLFFQFYFKKPL
jgi:hypothetical protein